MSSTQFVSRDEYKQQKALEEARKAGKIPAQLDEEGKEINPHMPQYITVAPWYLNQSQPSMKHQYFYKGHQNNGDQEWYARGQRGFQATKYRKGACENCGAATHTAKECCERPRKLGAKLTGENIKADDIIKNLNFSYDAKRHNWNGYDSDDYMQKIKEYEQVEELRKKKKEQELEASSNQKYDDGTREQNDRQGLIIQTVDPKTKTSSMDLRIREDKPKYLLDLDENSAYFNPKCRSMRENPTPNDPNSIFKGENSLRITGDAIKLINQEKFAWDQVEKNNLQLSSIANPTLTEKVFKEMLEKDKNIKNQKIKQILQVYGGEEHLDVDFDLVVGQTDKYAEYSADGQQLDIFNHKKSKYIEDVYINNHVSVWGSWYSDILGWGYDCCHNNVKDSTCAGEKGKKEALVKEFKIRKQKEEELKKLKEDEFKRNKEDEIKRIKESEIIKKDEFKAPLAKKKKNINDDDNNNEKIKKIEKKRKYNSQEDYKEISEEDIENYRKQRKVFDDPMNNYHDEEYN